MRTPALPGHRNAAAQTLVLAAALTLLLYALPWLWPPAGVLAWPLRMIATLAHELGHGLTALLLRGDFETLRIYADTSGVASHRGAFTAVDRALVAAGGPLGPPFAALLMFAAATRATAARVALWAVTLLLAFALLFWVANLFGFAFIGCFAALLALLAWRLPPRGAQIACAFLALELALSTFARSDYLFSAEARTGAGVLPSDTAQIAQALGLAHWFWGGLIAIISLAVVAGGLWLVARATR